MLTHNSLNVHSEIPRSCSSAHSSLWLVDLPTGRSKLSSLSWTELLRLDTLVDNRQNRSHAGYLKQPSLPSTNGDVSSVVGSAQNSTSTSLRTVVRVATPINASRCDYYCDQLSTTWTETAGELRGDFCTHLTLHNRDLNNARLCSSFSDHFTDKIDKLKLAVTRDSASYPDHPLADHPHHGLSLDNLRPVTSAEVLKIITALPSKCCPLDFIPTPVIKSCSSILADISATLANLSFEQGKFPSGYKAAVVTPLLKNLA